MARTAAPVEMIAVDADGILVMWHADGLHTDDRELAREIEFAARVHEPVEIVWGVEPVKASLEDPTDHMAILAALMAARPGRSRVLRSTPKIDEWFAKVPEEDGMVY
jgi:hypothetical protein